MALLSSASSKAYNAWAASAISIWCVASVVQGFSVGPTAVVRHSYYGSKTTSSSSSSTPIVAAIRHTKLLAKGDDFDDDNDEDDEDSDLLADSDWRDFRAKLVMGENAPSSGSSSSSSSTGSTKSKDKEDNAVVLGDDGDLDGIGSIFQDSGSRSSSSSARSTKKMGSRSSTDDSDTMSSLEGMTPLDPSQWAYDSGKIIEQGAVILGGVEQDFGFGLRQQYFHKAAILVLDHEESTFTKGIILNRPTDLTLEDDINPGVRWRVWFGGDVQGLDSPKPDIVCLHSLKNPKAEKASIKVMKDIQWTTFENAKRLVQVGAAQASDFWVFIGYAGWGPGQLMGELDRKSWYMVATDSQTLLTELGRQSAASDPREAGLDSWTLLMNMIGRSDTAKEHSGDFDDLMLKEWALKNLLSNEAGGGAGSKELPPDAAEGLGLNFEQEPLRKTGPLDPFLDKMRSPERNEEIFVGSVVRASPAERSPFLLDGQEFHKSIVLVLSDENGITVGAILNRPASKGLDIQIKDKSTGNTKKVKIPLRFGGQYTVQGKEALLWLHCNPRLRDSEIGSPVGNMGGKIWKCTADDVINSIGRGLATPDDFLVISGVSVWSKAPGVLQPLGMQGEVYRGNYEVVRQKRIEAVWKALAKQDVLTSDNLTLNLEVGADAWSAGASDDNDDNSSNSNEKADKNGESSNGSAPPMGGLGEGFDEEDDSLVFKSDVKVETLSDEALRSWVTTFLLGLPTLGG